MTNKEKQEIIEKALEDQTLFKVKKVLDINHDPHPFMIGPKHITHAASNHGSIITEETLKAVPCAHRGCITSYEGHTYDTICALEPLRNGNNDEANSIIFELVQKLDKGIIDGFIFVETEEKFRISKPVEK